MGAAPTAESGGNRVNHGSKPYTFEPGTCAVPHQHGTGGRRDAVQHRQLRLQRPFSFSERPRRRVRASRIPPYFKVELTIAKILGVLALLIPAVPFKVKEFAYAGFAITLASAAIAHFGRGDARNLSLIYVIDPLVFLCLLAVSYYYFDKRHTVKRLQPATRLHGKRGGAHETHPCETRWSAATTSGLLCRRSAPTPARPLRSWSFRSTISWPA